MRQAFKKNSGRAEHIEIKPTHLRHLCKIARYVAAGQAVQVRDLARYVVGALKHQLQQEARARTVQRVQLRAAAREHQADLAQDVAAGRARAAPKPEPKFRPLYYRGSHG